jgi:hypothetical protein
MLSSKLVRDLLCPKYPYACLLTPKFSILLSLLCKFVRSAPSDIGHVFGDSDRKSDSANSNRSVNKPHAIIDNTATVV